MTVDVSSQRKAKIYLLIGGTAIGLAPIFTRLAVEQGVGSVAAAFWRMCIGALGFAVIGFVQNQKMVGKSFKDSLAEVINIGFKPALFAGVVFALDLMAWHISFEYTSVANSTLLANFSSFLVPMCGVIFFKEDLRKSLLAGGACAIGGMVCLVHFGIAPAGTSVSEYKYLGDALAFLTAFFYTGYMLSTKHLAKRLNPGALMLVVSSVSAVVLIGSSLALNSQVIPDTSIGWIWILGLGCVSQLLGQGFIAKALTLLPVSQSALMLLAAPVSSAIFGVLILGQTLQPGQLVGVVCTIAGIAIIGSRK